ncbi:MAG: MCE family protein [Negativicutes bacterium]|nr:MCE family protein [Negativicutes bacterium]
MSLSTEAKVGTVSVIGLVLLAFMIVHLGGFSFGDKGYPVYAVFNQVGGLKAGNAVRYAGVDIGRVEGISVVPEGVKVQLMINPGVQIPAGCRFVIGTDGLLGEKFVDIVPPRSNSGVIAPHAVVRGEDPQGLDTLVANADKVLLDVQKLVQALNDILGDEKVKAALKESALNTKEITARLSEFSAALARMAVNNEADVNALVQNLSAMSGNLRDIAGRVDKLIAGIENNGQTAADIREMLHNLKITSARVERMAAALEGVAADPETAQNIKDTLRNARDATAKANKMLARFEQVNIRAGFEVTANTDTGRRRSDADLRINTSPADFAVIGVSNIGEKSKMTVQAGKGTEEFAGRAGIVYGKPGVGVDTQLGRSLSLSVDAYDPNDLRIKLRTQYKIAPDTFIVGQTDSLNKEAERNTYIGIRREF